MNEAQRCDVLVVHGQVLTVDDEDRVLDDGAVAISANRIAALGRTDAIRRGWTADRVLDARGGLVLPGLVNGHTHLAMTLFRGCADDVDLQGFLARVWELERATISPGTVRLGATAGIVESLRAGTTTALDMYYHHEVSLDVAEVLGFRLVTGPTLFELPAPDFPDFESRYAAAAQWLQSWQPGLGLRACVCPHATYTLDRRQLEMARELADAHEAVIHVHASENSGEVTQVLARHGGTPIDVLDDTGLLRSGTVLAHGVALSGSEIRRIAAAGVAVAHCPASNLKLASGFAPVPELRRSGATVSLGTDGPSSSNDLDMWVAMRLAGLLHKARLQDPTELPAAEVLRMATIEGARSLGLEREIGSLELGKRADIVVMSAEEIVTAPLYDAHSLAVYSLGRGQVRHVLVDGRFVVEDGRVTGVSESNLVRALLRFAR